MAFLCRGRNRVEADISEENNCAAGDDPGKSRRSKRHPVRLIHQHSADDQEREDGTNFNRHHYIVSFRRFAHASDQQQRQHEDNQETWHIEIGPSPATACPNRARPFVGQMDAESGELRFGITAESNGNRDVADHVLQNQVPADNPGKNFAQRRVRVCVRATRNRDHRSQFGIAEPGKAARNRNQNE